MRTGYSPYDMCNEAVRLIDSCSSGSIDPREELQIVLLLNKSDSYSDMSAYQLSIARKKLADLYYKNGITGSALDQYSLALQANPKLSVKKRIKELDSIPKPERIYSIDPNIVGEPDYSNLKYYSHTPDEEFIRSREGADKRIADLLGITVEELHKIRADARKSAFEQANIENAIYDPEFEKEIDERLSRLDELSKKEFYRIRAIRKPDEILSDKKLDLLTLEAMEQSYNYRNNRR
jgi:hypothetical protein